MPPTRSAARLRALEILFEAEQRQVNPEEVISHRVEQATMAAGEYAETIVTGVTTHIDQIDELLSTYSRGWTLERMPRVDLMALRIGTWELLHNPEIPDGVAVSEAVTLARRLSTEDSPRFVNGVLGRIQKLKPTLIDE